MRSSGSRLLGAALGALVTVAACTGGTETAPVTTVAVTTTTQPPREEDGRLTIGVLLPTTDAVIGEPMIAAVEEAVTRINAAGGVLGRPVQTVIEDEGVSSATAGEAIQRLLAESVDAIVGPSSSLIALSTLDEIVAAEVVACSPTASALALDDFPDDDLFFRTVPSDSLQAEAIADVVEQTGAQTAAIAYVDDAYGRPFADAVTDALRAKGVTIADAVPFSLRDDDLTDDAQRLVDSEARVAILLAGSAEGTNFLNALGQVQFRGFSTVVVNDAMRTPLSPQLIQSLNFALRNRIVGVAPQAQSEIEEDPFDPPGLFAVNAFDCVNLIALAAMQVNSDDPTDIAGQMPSVSAGGSICRTFEACAADLENDLQIDYNGPSGVTELIVRRGDPRRARFELFGFDESGRDVYIDKFIADY